MFVCVRVVSVCVHLCVCEGECGGEERSKGGNGYVEVGKKGGVCI